MVRVRRRACQLGSRRVATGDDASKCALYFCCLLTCLLQVFRIMKGAPQVVLKRAYNYAYIQSEVEHKITEFANRYDATGTRMDQAFGCLVELWHGGGGRCITV